MVLENSVEEFVERFREYAAQGQLYPQPENAVLLEFAAGGRVLYLFDRTGPYTARPGEARVIVHGVLSELAPAEDLQESLFSSGVSQLEGVGQITELQRGFLIVRCRLPLVLGVLEDRMPEVRVGDWIAFKTLAPVHGFVV
ncbi:hypothetical protein HNR42_002148 [Deinobacterium chartae]|uniref:Uncharacterized protein n=1 Tax=Deinobacterium chartae TaxID=521158 RepID=A0A841I0I5_9DEIO|nr:hypothetical protein [Deinobacterium chartae]